MSYAKKAIIGATIYAIMIPLLLGIAIWTSVAYYTWPCSRLKADPIMQYGYTPARCIR